ncbi:uncharacterized protein [Nicotiana sylvestris]|uniref:uncharacterized protein n=1 Tax=Nicotiana sylvestris TaxID=4096 RepID=UPI00388CE3BD
MDGVVDLQDCIDACELMELPFGGCRYTWNKKHGDNRVFSKIDWTFVNREWFDNTPVVQAIFQVDGISDHYPLRIKKDTGAVKGNRAFKFCNVWELHPQFKEIVTQGWKQQIAGSILTEVEDDREALSQAQSRLHADPSNKALQEQEKAKCQPARNSGNLLV